MRAVKSVSIDSERRVIITFLDGSTETLYPNCIWCDSEALRQLIKDLLEEKADAITQTIENATVATFADGADEALIRKLLVSIEPIQEGTGYPSPENVRPISGRTGLNLVRTGKNLINDSIKTIGSSGLSFFVGGDGSYNTYLVAGTYTFSCVFDVGVHYALFMREKNDSANTTLWTNTSDLSEKTFILTKSGYYRFWFYNTGVISPDSVTNIMLEFSSTSSEYEPYKGSTYSVNWETEAGTVYGGSLDVVSGQLTVTRQLSKINSLNWTHLSVTQGNLFRSQALDTPLVFNNIDFISSAYKTTTASTREDLTISCGSNTKLDIIDNRYTTVEDFVSAMGEETVCYPISTPIPYQLMAQEITTLLGINNIRADSGDILELEYVADTKLYIGESQSGTLGSGRHTISNTDVQPVSEKTWEDVSEAYKTETAEKETQEETVDERGE